MIARHRCSRRRPIFCRLKANGAEPRLKMREMNARYSALVEWLVIAVIIIAILSILPSVPKAFVESRPLCYR